MECLQKRIDENVTKMYKNSHDEIKKEMQYFTKDAEKHT